MADVNAQSVEEFADRVIYRYPAARFEQVAVLFEFSVDSGLKTLVNTATNTSFIVPASGISSRFFKVEWTFNLMIVAFNTLSGGWYLTIATDFLRYVSPSPALNYDGKSYQTEFYDKKTENYIAASQLRSINIQNLQVEPVSHPESYLQSANYALDFGNPVTQLVGLLQPVVTSYKK